MNIRVKNAVAGTDYKKGNPRRGGSWLDFWVRGQLEERMTYDLKCAVYGCGARENLVGGHVKFFHKGTPVNERNGVPAPTMFIAPECSDHISDNFTAPFDIVKEDLVQLMRPFKGY